MSESKTFMAGKLSAVQKNLMGMEFEDTNLHTILPIIFRECQKENMTFWFNFIENHCVLNLRDTGHDNYELNIRQYIGNSETMDFSAIKRQVLCNAFLLTVEAHQFENSQVYVEPPKVHESEKMGVIQKAIEKVSEESEIQESKLVPPRAIRAAMDECTKNNEPITKKNLETKLQLGKMSTDNRRQCIAYLKSMEE